MPELAEADGVRSSRSATRCGGADRVVLSVYALFVLAAGGRSAVQLAGDPNRALLACVLSACAAAVYTCGLVALSLARRRGTGRRRALATACCVTELIGVLAVGSLSVARPGAFPDATVWSRFGSGYLFVPVLLPLAALLWLHRRPT